MALRYAVSVDALMGTGKRCDSITRARDVACYCAHQMTLHSTTSIGEHFGGRDNTRVQDSVARVRALMAGDPIFRQDIRRLVATIDPIHTHKEYAR